MLAPRTGDRQGAALAPVPVRLRRAVFALLYGPGARFYDRFTDRLYLGEWARWQETALPSLPDEGLIVELGAGTGRLAGVGAQGGRRWLGLEPSPTMLGEARWRRRVSGPSFVRGRADAIPLPNGAARAVVATFPTAYIFDPAVAAEVWRVLAATGRFVVVLDGTLRPDGWRRRARCGLLRLFYGGGRSRRTAEIRFDRIDGRTVTIDTPHGCSTVYVGTPRARWGDRAR